MGGHFEKMQIKKMPPPIFDVITQKYLLEELRTPENQKPRLHIFWRGSSGFLPDYKLTND